MTSKITSPFSISCFGYNSENEFPLDICLKMQNKEIILYILIKYLEEILKKKNEVDVLYHYSARCLERIGFLVKNVQLNKIDKIYIAKILLDVSYMIQQKELNHILEIFNNKKINI